MDIKIYEEGVRDPAFYAAIGPFALNRNVTKELHDFQYGGLYDEDYATWFLAYEGKMLLGFCSIFIKEKELFFDNCYVLKAHRGNGIGKALFARRMEYARDIQQGRRLRGITKDEIQYHLYCAHGFKLASKRGKYYWLTKEAEKHG